MQKLTVRVVVKAQQPGSVPIVSLLVGLVVDDDVESVQVGQGLAFGRVVSDSLLPNLKYSIFNLFRRYSHTGQFFFREFRFLRQNRKTDRYFQSDVFDF